MTSNTNNKTDDRSETLAQLYEVLLYKKKDIIAIQKKLRVTGINGNVVRKQKHLLIHMSC
jgi:hypothetical protein